MMRTELSLVELSDSKEIAALLATQPQPQQRPAAPPRVRLATRSTRRRRCQCGTCPSCAENARWDKIFNEKFADPNYYKAQPVRHTSSLSWPPR
jgi:predicted  nucleic acid-binding Zn ribbon protein